MLSTIGIEKYMIRKEFLIQIVDNINFPIGEKIENILEGDQVLMKNSAAGKVAPGVESSQLSVSDSKRVLSYGESCAQNWLYHL